MAKKIDDLPIFGRALEFWNAVNAILDRPGLRRNRKLWDQIAEANDSITSNMREGFEQTSDDSFANFLVYAKGSVAEVVTRLQAATGRGLLSEEEFRERVHAGEELGKMLGGFIKYLRRSGYKDRGSFSQKALPKTTRPRTR